jgi:hypothetical protein
MLKQYKKRCCLSLFLQYLFFKKIIYCYMYCIKWMNLNGSKLNNAEDETREFEGITES